MNGISVTILVAAFLVLVAGLFAVIVERTTERDEARTERDRLEAECNNHAAENARLTAGRRLSVVPPQREASGGLLCIEVVELGRGCACKSHPNVPSALPYMNKHGEAACECHSDTATTYDVTPFPCGGAS